MSAAKSGQPEIVVPRGALHAVEKGREINELRAGVWKIKVEGLCARHNPALHAAGGIFKCDSTAKDQILCFLFAAPTRNNRWFYCKATTMELKNFFRAAACTIAIACSAEVFAGETQTAAATGTNAAGIQQDQTPASLDLFNADFIYTGPSNISGAALRARQDSTYSEFDYAHRFPITGNWYFRLGLEYERYDFAGAAAPLPDHLQGAFGIVAVEYVVHDFPAVELETHPGFYFENNVTGRNFDAPTTLFTTLKLYDTKVFGLAGVHYGELVWPTVSGFGGIIWLINDKWRLQAIIPHPSLVYDPNDDWECQLKAEINGDGFRLDESGRTPGTYTGAALRYTYDRVGLQATYKKWKPFSLTLGAGYNIQREFDFIHYGPDQKFRSSGAPYVEVSFGANF